MLTSAYHSPASWRPTARLAAEKSLDAVIGAESSGIAFAPWLAERLELPRLCRRKRPMGWGSRAA